MGNPSRAGFIPYVVEEGEPLFYFMVPSDEKEEAAPCIAKGGVDRGETAEQAALREGGEELGLRESNLVPGTTQQIFEGLIKGKKETYRLTVFIGEVKSKDAFGEPDHETKDRQWLTAEEFKKVGRKSHNSIVRKAASLLSPPKNV